MVLVLKNDQMENLLPMAEEIDAIEQAFRELGQGKAMNAPRARLRTPVERRRRAILFQQYHGTGARHEVDGAAHRLELLEGSPGRRQQAARLSRRFHRSGHALRHGHLRISSRSWTIIIISTMRVGATSAVASKYLRAQRRQSHGASRFRRAGQNPGDGARRACAS